MAGVMKRGRILRFKRMEIVLDAVEMLNHLRFQDICNVSNANMNGLIQTLSLLVQSEQRFMMNLRKLMNLKKN